MSQNTGHSKEVPEVAPCRRVAADPSTHDGAEHADDASAMGESLAALSSEGRLIIRRVGALGAADEEFPSRRVDA
jgi:hypothetical protein